MKYAVEMGSVAMIYIPSFIKIVSGIQKLLGGIQIQTDRMGMHKPTLGKSNESYNSSIVACDIRCRSNIFTEPLPGNNMEIFTEPFPSDDRGIHM
jgi:hypothetical protein